MIYKIDFRNKSGSRITESASNKDDALKMFNDYKKDPEFKVVYLYEDDQLIKEADMFNKKWIYDNGIPIVNNYDDELTLRALHYRLVALGMTNTMRHYKRVVSAMIDARWEDLVGFSSFKDHDRETLGDTDYSPTDVESKVGSGKYGIDCYMNNYNKNKWENQPYYPEVFIEKKALQGVFQPVCEEWNVALNPCKGYPSLTFLHDAYYRFDEAISEDKIPIILYFGDYDPSGEDIPRSIKDVLLRMGIDVNVKRIALMKEQVIEWNLPPAPAKTTDSRTGKWEGLGQVELDAVDPVKLKSLCSNAIEDIFNHELHTELIEIEQEEKKEYIIQLKDYVSTL